MVVGIEALRTWWTSHVELCQAVSAVRGVTRSRGVFVVFGAGLGAAVQDADELFASCRSAACDRSSGPGVRRSTPAAW
jgi:hypothetical protein